LTESDLPVVGLVGGGTTTECSVIDSSGAAIARARRGPSNPNFVSLAEARANVTGALEEALHNIDRCRAAALALFEPVAPDGVDATDAVLAPLLTRTTTIRRYTEHEAALAACGIFETEGIAVVAGTGSSAVAMRDGKRNVAGGWGALLGDEGSAYDIAMWAIRAAIRSSEGAGPSIALLERRVMAHFGVTAFAELVPLFYSDGVTRVVIADLCRVIAPDAAIEPVIAARFAAAGEDLAGLAVAAGRGVFDGSDTPAVAMSGGVWAAGDIIERSFATAIRRAYPNARLARETSRPAVGIARRVIQEVNV
jgi:N-acetylglucosamine kinase-like BadF-type ATPase